MVFFFFSFAATSANVSLTSASTRSALAGRVRVLKTWVQVWLLTQPLSI